MDVRDARDWGWKMWRWCRASVIVASVDECGGAAVEARVCMWCFITWTSRTMLNLVSVSIKTTAAFLPPMWLSSSRAGRIDMAIRWYSN